MRKLTLTLAATGALAASHAHACSCMADNRTPDEVLAQGHVIARGIVQQRKAAADQWVRYELAVAQTLNGALPDRIMVWTAPNEAMCGVNLDRGETIILLQKPADAPHNIGLCDQLPILLHRDEWEARFRAERSE